MGNRDSSIGIGIFTCFALATPPYLELQIIRVAIFQYKNYRFSGAILHSFCIFNRKIRGKVVCI